MTRALLRCAVGRVRMCVLGIAIDDWMYLDCCEDGVGFADYADDD